MSRYLDRKADVVFKKIFADHKHLLISFLNAILPLPVMQKIRHDHQDEFWVVHSHQIILIG